MTVLVDSLGDDFPTFPEFQQMLRAYEREIAAKQPDNNRVVIGSPPPAGGGGGGAQIGATVTARCTATVYSPSEDAYLVLHPDGTTHRKVTALAYDVSRSTHDLPGLEEPGHTYKCRRCGKFFTGGVGAVCAGHP